MPYLNSRTLPFRRGALLALLILTCSAPATGSEPGDDALPNNARTEATSADTRTTTLSMSSTPRAPAELLPLLRDRSHYRSEVYRRDRMKASMAAVGLPSPLFTALESGRYDVDYYELAGRIARHASPHGAAAHYLAELNNLGAHEAAVMLHMLLLEACGQVEADGFDACLQGLAAKLT